MDPGSGIEKIQTRDMGSGMNTPDLIFELKILQFFDADPEPGSGILSTLDLGSGMENIGSEIKIRIRKESDKHSMMYSRDNAQEVVSLRHPKITFIAHPSGNNKPFNETKDGSVSSLGRYVFGSEISYNKAPPRLPGLAC
jgi:hypothetical protein